MCFWNGDYGWSIPRLNSKPTFSNGDMHIWGIFLQALNRTQICKHFLSFRLESISIISFNSSRGDSIFDCTSIVFLRFDNFKCNLDSLIFFILEIVVVDKSRMNRYANTVTIRCVGIWPINISAKDLRVSLFNIFCRDNDFYLL